MTQKTQKTEVKKSIDNADTVAKNSLDAHNKVQMDILIHCTKDYLISLLTTGKRFEEVTNEEDGKAYVQVKKITRTGTVRNLSGFASEVLDVIKNSKKPITKRGIMEKLDMEYNKENNRKVRSVINLLLKSNRPEGERIQHKVAIITDEDGNERPIYTYLLWAEVSK